MGLRELITDVWSWLDYKPASADLRRPGRNAWAELTSSWVPDEDLRRLAAYRLLAAYDSNQAGQVAAMTVDDETGTEQRELGDASKLVDTALGYLLGSEQTISVAGAEHADDEPTSEAAAALAVQDRLRTWAEKELLPLRIQQAERTAILLGDAVYTLAWDPGKGRVLLRTWDPGLYFPEWPEDGEQDGAEFPLRVHLAWELPEDKRRGLKARLRRVTYELGPISPASRRRTAKDGSPSREYLYADDGQPILVNGDALNADTGVITRTYPWAPNRSSPWTCYLTDAEWDLDDLKYADLLYDLPMHKVRYRVRSDGEILDRLDLMADFIPVVHVTNSIPASGEHWGKPTVATVLQALDELSATDTSSSGASATTGSPIIGLAGARLPIDRATGQPLPVKVRPGTVWQLNDNGRMDVLDSSAQLAEARPRRPHTRSHRCEQSPHHRRPRHPRPDRPAVRVRATARAWPAGLAGCRHASGPHPQVRCPAANGAATSPSRAGRGLARGGVPARTTDVGTAHADRPCRSPRRGRQGRGCPGAVRGDWNPNAARSRVSDRGRTEGDRTYPGQGLRGGGQACRRHRRQRSCARVPRTA
ncbi:hypothetical protein [Streptomyces sp. NPDC020681]|uniref:hypothetical protein n=1 Tax=Streptomyces sp. NPDC020681 TaxID=3365083 RepID=UPI0037A29971